MCCTMSVHYRCRAGVMDNIKAGVPRGAYRGIVTVRRGGVTLHLAPTAL